MGIEELSIEEVASFLLLQETFPRSVHYALASFESNVKAMRSKSDRSGTGLEKIIRQASKARSELSWLERQDITVASMGSVLQQLLITNNLLGETVAKTFFFPHGREVIA
jgi:uncharacterized alpha-E superfamily protein